MELTGLLNLINALISKIGFSVCHQIPSRSFNFGNLVLPMCSRCLGIYSGFLIAALVLFILFRKKENDLPPLYVLIILVIFFLSTIIDGLASYFGLYFTNNPVRFVTGFLCGTSIMIILFPIFSFQYYRESKNEKIFIKPVKFAIFLAVISLFIIATLVFQYLKINLLGQIYYFLSVFSVIFTFYFVNLVMVLLIPSFSQKAVRLFDKHIIIPSLISLGLTSGELFAAFWFHRLMINCL